MRNYTVDEYAYWNELGSPNHVLFPDLREYFNYTVTIKAFTGKGLGPSSEPIILRTGESGKTCFVSYGSMNSYLMLNYLFRDCN